MCYTCARLGTGWTQTKKSVCVCVCDIAVAGPPYRFGFPEPCWTRPRTSFAVVSNSVQDGATALTATPPQPPSHVEATAGGKGEGESQLRPMRTRVGA